MATDWFDGRIARRRGRTSPLGSLLDPIADKILVLSVLIVLIGEGVFPGWMVALIVVREFLVSGTSPGGDRARRRACEARDLGKLKTWSQAIAAGVGGLAAAGRLERRRRLVGPPRRARPDVGLGPGLRAGGPAAPPRQSGRVVEPGPAPPAAAGPGALVARATCSDGPADRLRGPPLRLRPDLHAHGAQPKAFLRAADGRSSMARRLLLLVAARPGPGRRRRSARSRPRGPAAEIRLLGQDPTTFRADDTVTRGELAELVGELDGAAVVEARGAADDRRTSTRGSSPRSA